MSRTVKKKIPCHFSIMGHLLNEHSVFRSKNRLYTIFKSQIYQISHTVITFKVQKPYLNNFN